MTRATSNTAYTTNPALQLAYVLDTIGETVDWTSVETAADYCDEDVGGAPRWTCSISFDTAQSVQEIIDTLRTYAHCMVVPGPDGWQLIPDAPTSSSGSLTASDFRRGTVRISKRSRRDIPTVVSSTYTRTESDAATAWNTGARAYAAATGVSTGTLPWRESAVQVSRHTELRRGVSV